MKCKFCNGEGWVCEDHPEVQWRDGTNCCGGAGIPCKCNKHYPPWDFKQEREDESE